jgi:GNAT superfamily N-acetyltransferase
MTAAVPARAGYRITTEPAEMDVDVVHAALGASYWAGGVGREVVERSMRHSLCFAVLDTSGGGRRPAQVGFARVITDRATFAYLADVFVVEPHRGRGLGKWMIAAVMAHPDLQGLRRFMLATRDAHGLYARHGFAALAAPDRWMEIHRPHTRT